MIEDLVTAHVAALGLTPVFRWNTLQPPYNLDQGWPLALPEVQWEPNTRVILHFQDRITPSDTGCLELDQIEKYYGANASKVIVIFYSHGLNKIYSGPIQLVEYSTHNWLTVTDLLRIKDQWQGKFNVEKTQAWQCLNGRTCDHRWRTAEVLKTWPNGTLSYGTKIPLNQWDYSTYRGTENYDNFLRLLPLYQQSRVNVVTETDYNARPGVICEKTLYAFVAKQIPIIVGHPGAVQDCKDLGFDMLDDLVDHSYDWLPNEKRVEAALELNQKLILGQIDVSAWQSRIDRNHQYVLEDFLSWMDNRASQDLSRIF
jgi:hypothetical protein